MIKKEKKGRFRDCLRLHGFPETGDAETEDYVVDILKKTIASLFGFSYISDAINV